MNKPKIRFKGFEGEWKKVKIGDVAPLTGGFAFQSGQFKTSGVPIIRISNILSSGIVGGDFVYYNEFKGDSEFRLYKGDVVIAMSGATTGKVATFEANDFGYQNQRVGKFSRTNLVNYELLSKLVSAPNFQKKIISKLTSSAQPNASSKDIDSIDLVVPEETEEQRALASYFTSLDAQIAASTSRLSSLKQIKAASLLNMFPQKGETVPRVRFKGFEGEWKKMQFGVAFEYQRNNSLSRAELSDEGIVANIHYGDVLIKYGECLNVSKDVLTYVKDEKIGMALYKKGALRNGDVIFADAAEDNTVGKCTEVICKENVCIVSGLHTIACRPQVEVVERYLGYSLNSPSFHNQLLPHIQGTKISSISKNALSSTSIFLPSLPEQRAIASYFTALDAQITLHRERLEKLKQIKAACLEKMFA